MAYADLIGYSAIFWLIALLGVVRGCRQFSPRFWRLPVILRFVPWGRTNVTYGADGTFQFPTNKSTFLSGLSLLLECFFTKTSMHPFVHYTCSSSIQASMPYVVVYRDHAFLPHLCRIETASHYAVYTYVLCNQWPLLGNQTDVKIIFIFHSPIESYQNKQQTMREITSSLFVLLICRKTFSFTLAWYCMLINLLYRWFLNFEKKFWIT